MTVLRLGAEGYADWITSPFRDETLAQPEPVRLVIVDPGRSDARPLPDPGSFPVVVCWLGDEFGGTGPTAADVVVSTADVDALAGTIGANPLAAVALAVLLRSQVGVDGDAGLAAESAVYSMLQGGPEFASWRSSRPPAELTAEHGVVRSTRTDDTLTITLDRPHRHNAITSTLRDELVDALAVATVDPSITELELRGAGPSFCSGGDLDEFGTRADPASAHAIRLARSPARLIDRTTAHTTAHVHGSTLGGGIETAAFADRVVADPDTTFSLPEVGLGLIPGAGGTVSLTRRIGRQRTAALGLTCRSIDATTALAWGLVDDIAPISSA